MSGGPAEFLATGKPHSIDVDDWSPLPDMTLTRQASAW